MEPVFAGGVSNVLQMQILQPERLAKQDLPMVYSAPIRSLIAEIELDGDLAQRPMPGWS